MDSEMPYCFGMLGALDLAVQPLYKATKTSCGCCFPAVFLGMMSSLKQESKNKLHLF